ncbi:flagellar export chaperone FlgN [Salinibacterium hongtaonis]|uniref:Flagellar biosynthesis protein FlgN n=1 Tax=Homoserinimonas hongtaonis TaxID=2079791 RepID=A0A2U1T1U4_9MICO|nr:flagellar export chaperone FlgN [Salinibacterium hongtaonis]AWB90395.1 flagellar biosynthesis protein FlgN [Salinibacterium hongtaonis]PWB97835.1 flagellar biosynthesis protein FlgN [Salinibacterium hongtaonis]
MGANDVSATLWRERELLELLLFKLEEEQLLLTAGKTRWLQHATREVEQVLERLRPLNLTRTVEVSALAEEWGAPGEATLRDLINHAPEGPWSEIFSNHLTAMTELTGQIAQLRDSNEQFLRSALRSTQETIAGIGNDPGTYDASGQANDSGTGARLIDERL